MIETTFGTQDLPAADRFAHWQDCMRSHLLADMQSDHAARYRGRQRVLSLGAVHVWSANYHPVCYRRTPKLIRQSDPEVYLLALPRRGTVGTVCWGEREVRYGTDELHVMDSSRPFELRSGNGAGQCHVLGIDVPKALLPQLGNVDALTFRQGFSTHDGVGSLLVRFLDQLHADAGTLHPSDGPRLGTTVIDLLSALFAQGLDAEHALDPQAHRRTLTRQIQAFIQGNLADPGLTPRAVAEAHHISLSYLHRLFQDENLTVAAWIRSQRLERARRDLADPSVTSVPIHAIAARWGFTRAADFTRAFRATYGIAPSELRHTALHALAQASA